MAEVLKQINTTNTSIDAHSAVTSSSSSIINANDKKLSHNISPNNLIGTDHDNVSNDSHHCWDVITPHSFTPQEWPRRGVTCDGLTDRQQQALIRCAPEDMTSGFFVALFQKSRKENSNHIKNTKDNLHMTDNVNHKDSKSNNTSIINTNIKNKIAQSSAETTPTSTTTTDTTINTDHPRKRSRLPEITDNYTCSSVCVKSLTNQSYWKPYSSYSFKAW